MRGWGQSAFATRRHREPQVLLDGDAFLAPDRRDERLIDVRDPAAWSNVSPARSRKRVRRALSAARESAETSLVDAVSPGREPRVSPRLVSRPRLATCQAFRRWPSRRASRRRKAWRTASASRAAPKSPGRGCVWRTPLVEFDRQSLPRDPPGPAPRRLANHSLMAAHIGADDVDPFATPRRKLLREITGIDPGRQALT